MVSPLRVLLADDHPIVRQGLRGVLERSGFEVVAEASDGLEAVRLCGELGPDVVILDIAMPGLNGVEAAREILKVAPRTKTILLTVHRDDQYVVEALRAGISGYVLKTQTAPDLTQAIQEVSRGGIYLSPGISHAVVHALRSKADAPSGPLTARERQVLKLIAVGKATKEAAQILGISVKTAESHRTRIMEKLDLHDTASLVLYAVRRGLIQP